MAAALETLKANKSKIEATSIVSALSTISADPKKSAELKLQFEKLSKEYNDYMATQKSFVSPVAHISIDETNEGIETHMDIEFNGIPYHFESIKPKHTDNIHAELEQKIVKEKFGDGTVQTKEQVAEMVERFSGLFSKKEKDGKPKLANPYSSLVLTDAESGDFLGLTFLRDVEPGKAEIGLLNSVKTWSQIPAEVVTEYAKQSTKLKSYNGVGTMEVCALYQYGAHLKSKGYKAHGQTLDAIISTARVDNLGSWKSHAKAGFQLGGIKSYPQYGTELRYQMQKTIN